MRLDRVKKASTHPPGLPRDTSQTMTMNFALDKVTDSSLVKSLHVMVSVDTQYSPEQGRGGLSPLNVPMSSSKNLQAVRNKLYIRPLRGLLATRFPRPLAMICTCTCTSSCRVTAEPPGASRSYYLHCYI